MIKITKQNNEVYLTIETTLGFNYTLKACEGYEYQAILVKDRLSADIENRIRKIREEAYNQGWKDNRKGVKNKKKNFFGTFETGKGVGY